MTTGAYPEKSEVVLPALEKKITRPIVTVQETPDEKPQSLKNKFAISRKRCLIGVALLTLIIAVIVCAVVGTQLKHKAHKSTSSQPYVADPNTPTTTNVTDDSPIDQAITTNFADPSIIKYNDTWYAFATNNAAGILQAPDGNPLPNFGKSNVQLATSTDFKNWTLLTSASDPLPSPGAWVASGYNDNNGTKVPRAAVWAPDIMQRSSDNKFVLYYAAVSASSPKNHCIGAALASTPEGPYDALDTTIACPTGEGGAIDAAPVKDADGKIYVVYKIDGNNRGNGGICGNTVSPIVDTPILLQQMKDDATTPTGTPIQLLDRTDDDGPLVEAPAIVHVNGTYFLFFSSGCTRMPSYDVKVATASKISGPYTRASKPLLQTSDFGLLAPGSVTVRQDGEAWRMVFHARVSTQNGGVRAMFTTKLHFNGTEAHVAPDT